MDALDGLLTLEIIEIICLGLVIALVAAWILSGRDE